MHARLDGRRSICVLSHPYSPAALSQIVSFPSVWFSYLFNDACVCIYTVRQSSLNISGQLSLPSWKSKQEPGKNTSRQMSIKNSSWKCRSTDWSRFVDPRAEVGDIYFFKIIFLAENCMVQPVVKAAGGCCCCLSGIRLIRYQL